MERIDANLTRDVRALALNQGASLVGIATPDRFDGAPRGHHPQDIVEGSRSVVTFGIRIPWLASNWPVLRMAAESDILHPEVRSDYLQNYFYKSVGYDFINERLNQIAVALTNFQEDRGYTSIYFPTTYGEEHSRFMDMMKNSGFGPFSQRHAAVLSGLAEFGLNNVAVTPQYGPRIRFNSVITEAPLEPNSLLNDKRAWVRAAGFAPMNVRQGQSASFPISIQRLCGFLLPRGRISLAVGRIEAPVIAKGSAFGSVL